MAGTQTKAGQGKPPGEGKLKDESEMSEENVKERKHEVLNHYVLWKGRSKTGEGIHGRLMGLELYRKPLKNFEPSDDVIRFGC